MGPIHLIANPNVCLSLLLNARKQSTPVPPPPPPPPLWIPSCRREIYKISILRLQSSVSDVKPWGLPPFTQGHPGGYHLLHRATLGATTFYTGPPWGLPPITQGHPGGYHLLHSARALNYSATPLASIPRSFNNTHHYISSLHVDVFLMSMEFY